MSFEQAATQGSEGISDDPNVELNNTLPAPPSLFPSSSSSSNLHPPSPALSNDQLISSMATQIAQLFSLVGRLSSENEALKAQVGVHSTQLEAHSSSIAQLSAENEELKRSREETTKTMEEMSRAFGSHWVWEAERREGEGGKGRWTWSEEKYRRTSDQVVARSKPPPSLDSIPVELFNSIASLLDLPNHLALCRVSFRILELASALVYVERSSLTSSTAARFIGPRISNLTPPSTRISSLLLPRSISFATLDFDATHFLSLPTAGSTPIASALFFVSVHTNSSITVVDWSPLLTHLDPVVVSIVNFRGRTHATPTVLLIDENALSFLPRWTRLKLFQAVGASTVPLFDNGALALSGCLTRCDAGKPIRIDLITSFSDGKKERLEVFEEGELSTILAREDAPDPTKSIVMLPVGSFDGMMPAGTGGN